MRVESTATTSRPQRPSAPMIPSNERYERTPPPPYHELNNQLYHGQQQYVKQSSIPLGAYPHNQSLYPTIPATEMTPIVQQNQLNNNNNKSKQQKTINLNLDDLSAISNRIKSDKSHNFMELNKHIGKNKPLSETRASLVNNKYLSDIRFKIGNEIIFAHKLFIATASARFLKHFYIDGKEEMDVNSIDRETFIDVLNYCYTGQLKINEENVLSVFIAAKMLEIKQITNICSSFIHNKMNADSIFVIFEKAIKHEFKDFQKKCLEFIAKNEEKCFNSKGFFEIELNTLKLILDVCKYPSEKSNQLIEKWHQGIHFEESVKPETGAVRKQPTIPINSTKPPEFSKIYNNLTPSCPFSPVSTENLINFDDDDDICGLICKDESDDDLKSELGDASRTSLIINGTTQKINTEFSRIDFTCKKTISICEIWFNENLFQSENFKTVRVAVTVFDGGNKRNVHNRVVKNGIIPGRKIPIIIFS